MVVTGFEASMNAVVATSFVEKLLALKLLALGLKPLGRQRISNLLGW
jgi:hypothetical protein